VKLSPSYCNSTTAFLYGVPFSGFCIASCKFCDSSATTPMPVTPASTLSQSNCSDMSTTLCPYYVSMFPSFCTSATSFFKGILFSTYCQLSCNNCNSGATQPTSTIQNPSTSASSASSTASSPTTSSSAQTTPVSTTQSTSTCSDSNSATCQYYAAAYPNYCTSLTAYIGGVRFNVYCRLSCNNCNAAQNSSTSATLSAISTTPSPSTQSQSSPSTASLSTTQANSCIDSDLVICPYYATNFPTYCTSSLAYINGTRFNVYCKFSCKNC